MDTSFSSFSARQLLDLLQENQSLTSEQQQEIGQILLERAEAFRSNQLRRCETIKGVDQHTLDDTTRRDIADLLSKPPYCVERQRINHMSSVLSKVVRPLSLGPLEVEAENNSLNDFLTEAEKVLIRTAIPLLIWQSLQNTLFALPVLAWIPSKKSLSLLLLIAAFGLSFAAYSLSLQFMTPFMLGIGGVKAAAFIAHALFWGLALLPAWIMVGYGFRTLKNGFNSWITQEKEQEIKVTLENLKKSQHFVASELSQSILDVAYFDFSHFSQKIRRYQDHLQMKPFTWIQKRIYPTRLLELQYAIQRQLNTQLKRIQKRAELISVQVVDSLDKELKLLCFNPQTPFDFMPTVNEGQINKIADFIGQFAQEKERRQFKERMDVIHRFIQLLKEPTSFEDTSNPRLTAHGQSWGRKRFCSGLLQGWKIILKSFGSQDDTRLGSALTLLSWLNQEVSEVKKPEWEAVLEKLCLNETDIQLLIWNILETKNATLAQFIGVTKLEKLIEWHLKYKDQIEQYEADDWENLNEKAVALRDGAFIYYQATQKKIKLEAHYANLEKRFKDYTGQDSAIYSLLRFFYLPEKETKWLFELYKKRQPILRKIEEHEWSQNDILLMNDTRIVRYTEDNPDLKFVKRKSCSA